VVRGERFPTSQRFMWLDEMAESIRQSAPDLARKVPRHRMPDWLVKLLALFMPEMRQIKSELGNMRDVSGRHTEDRLGLTFTPAERTLEDTVRSLVQKGIVKL